MNRQSVTIDQIKADVPYACVGGPFGSDLTTRDYVEEGVPVIRGSNLPMDRAFVDEGFVFVSEQKANALMSNIAYPGDLLFTQRGTLGQVGLIPEDARFDRYIVSQSQMKLTVDDTKANRLFIYYYFRQSVVAEIIKRRAITSGVPHINLGILKGLELVIPSVQEQTRIAGFLAEIDRAIENNRRRIQLLEQSARLLYKEWFIQLRFPGHEHVKVVDGLPEGWKMGFLSDLCDDVREGVRPSNIDPTTPYIGLEHIPRRSITLSEWGNAEDVTSNKFRFRQGDILFGKIRPYFHKVGFALTDGITSSDTIVIRPHTSDFYHCVLMLVSSEHFVAVASKTAKEGSKMPRADWKHLRKFPVTVPPKPLRESFGDAIAQIVAQLKTLVFHSRKLSVARDLLLPRLMSGEIEV